MVRHSDLRLVDLAREGLKYFTKSVSKTNRRSPLLLNERTFKEDKVAGGEENGIEAEVSHMLVRCNSLFGVAGKLRLNQAHCAMAGRRERKRRHKPVQPGSASRPPSDLTHASRRGICRDMY